MKEKALSIKIAEKLKYVFLYGLSVPGGVAFFFFFSSVNANYTYEMRNQFMLIACISGLVAFGMFFAFIECDLKLMNYRERRSSNSDNKTKGETE